MKFTKKANNAIRRFIACSAATVQSRKRIKLALGSCPSAAENSHGAVLAANFHERPTDVDEHGRIRQMIELENVWTAKTTINLCQGDPNADPTPVDIFSLSEMAEGEKYFVPLQFRPSAKDGWYSLKGHIQRAGHLDGSQLTCAGSPGLKSMSYKVQCFRHSLSRAEPNSSSQFADHAKPKSIRRSHYKENGGKPRRGTKRRVLNSTGPTKKGPKEGTKYHSNTRRPQHPEDQCPVVQYLFVDEENDRFYFKTGVGCNTHCKHPKICAHEIVALVSSAPENVTETQHQLARAYGSTGVAQRLATEQSDSDVHYSPGAVRKWRKEAMSNINADQCGKIASVDDDGANEFVNMLRADPTVSALFVYDEVGLGVGPKSNSVKYTIHSANGDAKDGDLEVDATPAEVKHQIGIVRAASGKKTGRILLLAVWTTTEEARRFYVHPEVCSWDVTEGTNNEQRGLFLGLNYGADLVSNVHTNVFIPNNQRWVFQYLAKKGIPLLHGQDTISRIQVNVFDQAINEYGPFLSNMTADVRFCAYHRLIQKTAPYRGMVSDEPGRSALKDFDVLCDSISDKVENEMEYELTLELTKMYVEKLHEQGTFSPLLVAEINKQIDAIDFHKQHIANHFFLDKFNMKKRTTTANECRHRNIKYGEDGIGPSHSLAQSGGTQNAKRKASTNRKQSRDARDVTSVSLWGQNVSHVSPEAGRILLGMWESRLAYDSARIDEKTWLVACLEPDPMQNAVEPQYHRCRTVKLVDGCHLECDCKQMTWLGIACPHILCITDEVHESCWITRWWNEFVFYCRRPGVSKEISQAWEDLAFNSPKQPGVLFRNVPKADQYPVLSDPSVPLERFIDLRDSPVPVVLNYDPETIAVALERIKSRMPSVGMSVEMDFADGHNPSEFTFPAGDGGDDDDAVPFPDSKADDLYFSMKAYAGSISKQNPDGPMRREIEHVLAELAVKSMLRAEGKYDPPTAEELAQRSANVTGLPDSKKGDEDEDESSSQYLSFCSQVPTTKTKDERIPQYWER